MIRLLFIVPYPDLHEKVKYVLAHYPERHRVMADVRVLTVDKTIHIQVEQYDAIIARGYSAKQLKEMYPQIPTFDLVISGYDIIHTVIECQKKHHPSKIALCGVLGKLYEAKDVCLLLGCDVEIYSPDHYQNLEGHIQDAIASGCDAIIGGYTASTYAEKYQMPFQMLSTGQDTIYQTLNEAIRTVEEIRKERIVSETYKTIIYTSKDGILYVDAQGIIRVRNRVIRKMNHSKSLFCKTLEETFPFLYPTFTQVLATGQEMEGKIYALPGMNMTVSAAFTPVIVNQTISGVVITLMDITQIQKLENQIRRTLSEKGLRAKYTFGDIIHESDEIALTIDMARKYAGSESNVILVGETGTGKELFAQSIHNASTRKNGPFVAINCAALPETLLESELFGYVEGAFTGTIKGGKMGLFEQAHGGTLFLDEIGEISISVQTKLLRALQEREVRRIGDNKVISVNVRIISATNKSVRHLTEQGLFRKDLAYRLDVLRIFLPPLRQRGNDVELLFLHLFRQHGTTNGRSLPEINIDALSALQKYPFNGNIRELSNIVERASVLCNGGIMQKQDILDALYPRDLEEPSAEKTQQTQLDSDMHEQERLLWALETCSGNKKQAAQLLQIDRSTLWRKLKKYLIE